MVFRPWMAGIAFMDGMLAQSSLLFFIMSVKFDSYLIKIAVIVDHETIFK